MAIGFAVQGGVGSLASEDVETDVSSKWVLENVPQESPNPAEERNTTI